VLQIELPLHRQFRVGDFSFRFFGHVRPLNSEIIPASDHFIDARGAPQVTARNILLRYK
jgi:hypothetical protein